MRLKSLLQGGMDRHVCAFTGDWDQEQCGNKQQRKQRWHQQHRNHITIGIWQQPCWLSYSVKACHNQEWAVVFYYPSAGSPVTKSFHRAANWHSGTVSAWFPTASPPPVRKLYQKYGALHKWGYPAGWFIWDNPKQKWMIWGYPYFRKPPYPKISKNRLPSGNGWHSYWKWWLIVSFPIKHGDFP